MGAFRFVAAVASILAAQTGHAQLTIGCPTGQAMQKSDPSGMNVTCVVIPNVAPLQAAITDETVVRAAADAKLEESIRTEVKAREGMDGMLLQAIDDVRASVNQTETKIEGRYAFSGYQTCVNATLGFNTVDLTPLPSTQTSQNFVSISTSLVTGFRTFNSDGTGFAQFNAQSVGPGGGSISELTGTFDWHVRDGKLFINDHGSTGTVIFGGPRVGWTTMTRGPAPHVGVLGKDLRTISIVHDGLHVEEGIQISPLGAEFRTPRVCLRERLLRKL